MPDELMERKCSSCGRKWSGHWNEDCPFCAIKKLQFSNKENMRLLRKQQEQLNKDYPWKRTLDHNGIRSRRIESGIAERVFREEWVKHNQRKRYINHGYTTIELLLIEFTPHLGDLCAQPYLRWPDQRDAEVAATIIQWLGTNCGVCFLRGCEKRIEEEKKKVIESENIRRKETIESDPEV